MHRFIFLAGILLVLGFHPRNVDRTSAIAEERELWVDSVYQSMSIDQRIGQLIMIRAHSDKGAEHVDGVRTLIKKYHVGGLCFFQGTLKKQAQLTQSYQKLSSFPLLIAQDAEWGAGMRLSDAIDFPKHMTLGAVRDNNLIYGVSAAIAAQLKDLGVHINFAPVADVNNNADNPVIHDRSFGESKSQVAVKSYMYMLGHQDQGVMACAKHFPGHGDTEMDSHYDLPSLSYNRDRLDSLELYPFKILTDQGISSLMVAHLQMEAFESDGKTPSSLSPKLIHNIIREDYKYDGVIFTDGLEMAGVRKHFTDREIATKAILAGNDILLLPEKPAEAFDALKKAHYYETLSEERLARSVKRILRMKYKAGLHKNTKVLSPNEIVSNHDKPVYRSLIAQVAEQSLTVLNNSQRTLPLQQKEQKILLIQRGNKKESLHTYLSHYNTLDRHIIPEKISIDEQNTLLKKCKKYDHVIISLEDMSRRPSKRFGISSSLSRCFDKIAIDQSTIFVLFGTPYGLNYLPEAGVKVVAYESAGIYKQKAAELLNGCFIARGKLPIQAGADKAGEGDRTNSLKVLASVVPEEVFMDTDSLLKIDKLVDSLLRDKAAPGCQVYIAKDGKIVWNKAYGYHTYDKKKKVDRNSIYDVASITKVAATTLSIMKLHEEGKVDIFRPIKDFLPESDTTAFADIMLYDVMAHHAGLKAWIPFYTSTLSEGKYKTPLSTYYTKEDLPGYSISVTDNLYLMDTYPDTILYKILQSEVRPEKRYVYSDLGFYLLAEIIKRQTGLTVDEYTTKHFYQPLGLRSTGFNAYKWKQITNVVPSEKDTYWRKCIVRGRVHDMGAAMQCGVSGHAGLFTTAEELGVIMQLVANGGYYGGRRYLKSETIELFTKRHPRSTRRGIGWDMKQLDTTKTENMSAEASSFTFGHTGFTGTAAWVDPSENLVFIFLSNRTYPSMRSNVLHKENYRPRLQTAMYRALKNVDYAP